MKISLFGWLNKIPAWRNLPYKSRGAILRALKSGLSVTLGILLAAAGQGILFPDSWSPMIVLVVTTVLQSVDKYIREAEIERQARLSPVRTDNPSGE